ncbi:MAG: DUF4433 domain-containing protein [Rhodocyclaceae bacterium]|nr:MAG: DUF4433 domain-containing protein [Rhodocyclaceae bacterium]
MFEIANWDHATENEYDYLVGMAIQNIKFGSGRITRVFRRGETAYFNAIFDGSPSMREFLIELLGGWNNYFADATEEMCRRRLDWPKRKKAASEAKHKAEIRAVLKERQISCLLHFTRIENLASILREGIIPRSDLGDREFIANDGQRADGFPEASCLSIGFPNYKMLYKYQQQRIGSNWAVLQVSPDILAEMTCSYYQTNAAAFESRSKAEINIAALQGAGALLNMFAEPLNGLRNLLKLPSDYSTDPQAEVLAFGRIDPKHIKGVALLRPDLEARQMLRDCAPLIQVKSPSPYFYQRHDHAHWVRRRWGDVCMGTVRAHNDLSVECV